MNIDALTGRELDIAVARCVLGYKVEERINETTGEKDAVSRQAPGKAWVRVAFYGASRGAYLNVEYELQHRGWKRKVSPPGSSWNEPADTRVVLEHADGRTVEASGPRYEALCRAALKAVTAER